MKRLLPLVVLATALLSVVQVGASSIDREAFKKQLQPKLADISTCYRKTSPEVSGKLLLKFTIVASGKVNKATASSRDLLPKALLRCCDEAMLTWRFSPFAGEPITIVYPVVLRPR